MFMETRTLKIVIGGVEEEVRCEILSLNGIWQAAIIHGNMIIDMVNTQSLVDCFAVLSRELVKLGEVKRVISASKAHWPLLMESHLRIIRTDLLIRETRRNKAR